MRLANYRDAATFLAMPLGTLYSLVHKKAIPHLRLSSKTVRFDIDELERWLEARRQDGNGDATRNGSRS